jgi:hypothetical protein
LTLPEESSTTIFTRAGRMKNFEYQKPLIAELTKIAKKHGGAYLQMPTGTGKTASGLESVKKLGKGKIVWLAGSVNLIAQTWRSYRRVFHDDVVDDNRFKTESSKIGNRYEDDRVLITTWQSFRDSEDFHERFKVSVLVFDEIHFGGSHDGNSFRKCRENAEAKYELYLSATPWDVNPNNFRVPQTRKTTALLTMEAAFRLGLLNEVVLVQVHTGNKLKLKLIAELEEFHGKPMEVLENEDIVELAKNCKDEKVALRHSHSLRMLIESRIRSLVDVFMEERVGQKKIPQAIMYVPQVKYIEYARAYLESKLEERLGELPPMCVAGIHGEASEYLVPFTAQKTVTLKGVKYYPPRIAITCKMMVEGTDIPPLENILDCNFKPTNLRDFTQKGGRTTRVFEGKRTSWVAYGMDASYFTAGKSNMVVSPDILDEHIKDYCPPEDEEAVREALNVAAGMQIADKLSHSEDALESDELVEVGVPTVKTFDFEDVEILDSAEERLIEELPGARKVKVTEVPLYCVGRASGHKKLPAKKMSELLSAPTGAHNSDLKKAQLIALAKSGAKRPDSDTTQLGRAISHYTRESSASYDPEFDKTIRLLRPDWFINTSELRKHELLQLAKSNVSRLPQKYLKRFGYYTNVRSPYYDAKFVLEVRKIRPDWFIKPTAIAKSQLITLAKSSAKRPQKGDPLAGRLSSYVCKTSDTYDPEFDKTIRLLRPDWFVNRRPNRSLRKMYPALFNPRTPNAAGETVNESATISNNHTRHSTEFHHKGP